MALFDEEKKIAIKAVTKACSLASKMQGTLEALDVINKEDLSPVTITDFSCQALINLELSKAFPSDEIMGEEDSLFLRNPQNHLIKSKVIEQIEAFFPSIKENEILDAIDKGGSEGGKNKRFWVIDPIDGTKGFIRNEQYAIALALIVNGKVVLGVLGCPRLKYHNHAGVLLSATFGQGAELQFLGSEKKVPLSLRPNSQFIEVIYCEPHASSTMHEHTLAEKVAQSLHALARPFRLDSQCKYALIAMNEASIYLRIPTAKKLREKIWDHAPGAIIVEEAGGKVSDLEGRPLKFDLGKSLSQNTGLLVTNGEIHEKALAALKNLWRPFL